MTSRLTSQAAVEAVGNRYDLVLIASARARELQDGATPLVSNGSGKFISTALLEIEHGHVGREYLSKVHNGQRKKK
jgi:DNA-directed RNA polymerase subunit omega